MLQQGRKLTRRTWWQWLIISSGNGKVMWHAGTCANGHRVHLWGAYEQAKYIELGDRRTDAQNLSRRQQEDNGHEQPKTGANGADTTFVKRVSYEVRSHKEKVVTPVYLLTQVPTYRSEV